MALRVFKPTNNNDVRNIIETIRDCYVKPEVNKEDGYVIVKVPTDQPQEVKFLIDELDSFIEGLKKNQ